ncbi:MAG: LamG domain-containing protein, partial [Victivallaceae bacterium]
GVEWPSQITHATWATGIRGGDGVIFNNIFWGMWRAMSISIEGWNSSMTYPVADQIRDLWVWGNTLDGSSYNTITLGYTPQEAINYALFLQEGRDYHEGTAKPGYEHYVYPHPLCSLVGYWKLDNDDSIQVDASYSGNNGSKHGSPLSITGYSGNALDFNGSSDYVEAPYSADFNTSEFTVSAWAKVEGGADTYRGLLSSRGSCHGYNIYAGSNNKWQFWTGTGTGYHALTGGDVVNSTWTHIVATYKNGTKTLYVNGVEYSGSSAMEVNSSQPFKIGTVDNYYYFNGAIDDVRYYSRAMSQTEIKAMYNRIPDPSFELNLGTVWSVRSGSPTSDPDEKYDGDQSLYFNKPYSNEPEVSVSMNNYVPVDGGKCYVLSAWAKGNNITLGTSGWHKLFVIGRWYDKNMVEISGVYPDIGINTGSFDWTKFEKSYTAPSNAVYYRATAAGIIGSGSGEGWLDLIEIRPAAE